MSIDQQIAAHFDRNAAAFDAIYSGKTGWWGRLWNQLTRENMRWRLAFTLEAVAPAQGKRTLDAGCGSGRYCLALAEAGAAEVVGLDLAPRMLEIARRLAREHDVADRCSFVQTDLLDYADDKPFDIVMAIGVFDYLRDSRAALAHLHCLTAGTLVAAFPSRWALRVPFRKIWWAWQRCYIRFYTRAEILDLCLHAGFRPDRLVRHGPIYMLVGRPCKRHDCDELAPKGRA